MAKAKTTTNHDEIRRWVEKNGGCPARVKTTGRGKNDPGILRIDYPGFSGQDTLVKMDWDAWFDAFEANRLAFIYEPATRFSKLIARTNATARQTRPRKATRRTSTTPKKRTVKRAAKRGAAGTKRPVKRTAKRGAKRSTRRAARSA